MTLLETTEPLPVRELRQTAPLTELLATPASIEQMRADLEAGDGFVVPGVINPETAGRVCSWLRSVGTGSLPEWQPIIEGSPNSHRMNRWDPRSHVGGCFHQFSFFPWNQDPLGLFELMAPVYALKNRLQGLDADSFLGARPQQGCTARVSVQCYPRGGGALNEHCDPVGSHQLTVPVILLSRPGQDFEEGGLYVVDRRGERLDVDAAAGVGAAVFLNARTPHGVAPIDPAHPLDWLAFSGRWALVAAVNRLAENSDVADSRDLAAGQS